MWVLTNFGAFMPAQRIKGTVPADDNRTLQIRSRRRIDLDRLRDRYLPDLGPTVVLKGHDYGYRAYCTPRQWGEALRQIAEGINYQSFKDTAEDEDLHDAYYDVWQALYDNFGGYGYPRRGSRKSRAYTSKWDAKTIPTQPALPGTLTAKPKGVLGQELSQFVEPKSSKHAVTEDAWEAYIRDEVDPWEAHLDAVEAGLEEDVAIARKIGDMTQAEWEQYILDEEANDKSSPPDQHGHGRRRGKRRGRR